MKYAIAALAAAVSLSGCAADLAQGYRSTPDYPAYADARDGYNDGLECTANLASMAAINAKVREAERKTGYKIDGVGPTKGEWLSGLVMSMVFAIAEARPYTPQDACAGAAAAASEAGRRQGYTRY